MTNRHQLSTGDFENVHFLSFFISHNSDPKLFSGEHVRGCSYQCAKEKGLGLLLAHTD